MGFRIGYFSLTQIDIGLSLAVAQWIVHMPPKRGIQVRFLSAGPQNNQNLSTGNVDKLAKVFLSHRFV